MYYNIKDLWEEHYGNEEQAYDYAGRLMMKSACGNPRSNYQPTIDHICPLSKGGKNVKQNLVICHFDTNEEKADCFPHWKTNGSQFHAKKYDLNGYKIIKER